ncbi:MAG TPA: Rne/Rng family ribonuclease [Candidatus Binataceae bacterium]|nr:Rne/Rng family ribonuclease [Candidatus Binataceae bacterium]
MKRELIINASALEVRVALLEDRTLTEFMVERNTQRGLAGNVYKGRVMRVLPGMQAAFVDIGLEKAGFLHVSDFLDEVGAFGALAREMEEGEVETEPVDGGQSETPMDLAVEELAQDSVESDPGDGTAPAHQPRSRRRGARRSRLPIEQQLRRNQEIIVQIAKEPIGTKGSRLTSFISLPGRHLVYMPTTNHLGMSRRIESADERNRLRSIVGEVRPPQGGFIIRTACEGVSKREIQQDVTFLTRLWADVVKKSESQPPATLLYADLDLALRAIRDLFSSDVDRLWCDHPPTHERLAQFVQQYMPRLRSRVSLYEGHEPVFDHFGIEAQIERALERKVWLKSGGYLVFDQAEALTAIDVNTGRFVGKKNQEETVLKTNLEAVEEVANQLRLRNIGGIIIVDFIDMTKEGNRKRVSEALSQALRRDKARTSMFKISELGLVQMTRKRTRDSLQAMLTEQCPRCEGRAVVKSMPTLAGEILRAIQRDASRRNHGGMLLVKVNPEMARYLYGPGFKGLEELEQHFDVKLVLKSKDGLEPGALEISQAPAAA